jgi:hypothetical protein
MAMAIGTSTVHLPVACLDSGYPHSQVLSLMQTVSHRPEPIASPVDFKLHHYLI